LNDLLRLIPPTLCASLDSISAHKRLRLTSQRILPAVVLVLLLAGCGSKGALYLPPSDQPRSDNNTRR
jgi:hypothetical protein